MNQEKKNRNKRDKISFLEFYIFYFIRTLIVLILMHLIAWDTDFIGLGFSLRFLFGVPLFLYLFELMQKEIK